MTDTPRTTFSPTPATRRDLAMVGAFALVVFCFSLVGGRPLTMHEARLPQTAQEMYRTGRWVVPTSGGRPWLERPPLPLWIAGAFGRVLGPQSVWPYRLPSALAGAALAVLTAWLAGRWFGRRIGLLAGLTLATTSEVVQYAWLAEQDIYLALAVTAVIALFARIEWFDAVTAPAVRRVNPVGLRRWTIALLLLSAGALNLIKGPLIGLALAGIPIAGLLLWDHDWRRIARYAWLWGWLLLAAALLAWPVAVLWRQPDAMDLWRFDVQGRLSGQYAGLVEPWWYYAAQLPMLLAPWTPLAVAGAVLLAGRAWRGRHSPERFVLCWALLPAVLLSIAPGKHHHYLLTTMPAWAILSAHGLPWGGRLLFWLLSPPRARRWLVLTALLLAGGGVLALGLAWAKVPGPASLKLGLAAVFVACVLAMYRAVRRSDERRLLTAILVVFVTGLFYLHAVVAPRTDQTIEDTAFLQRVRAEVPADAVLAANVDGRQLALDGFRILFYLGEPTWALPNLTYLRSQDGPRGSVYVVTQARDLPVLAACGTVEQIDQSAHSRRELSPADRLTLFRVDLREDLERYPAPAAMTCMQAMGRQPGPYCSPAK